MNYFRTVRDLFRQSFVNPYAATARHTCWQLRKLGNGFPYDVHLDGAVIRVANRSVASGCGAQLNALGYYDANNMRFLREICGQGYVRSFFDVGANIGVYSMIVARHAPASRVVAFEPHPATFLLLTENASLNRAQDRIRCLEVALGDHNGSARLQDRPANPGNRVVEGAEPDQHSIEITCRRGDSVCSELGYLPDVIKIDVEGFENRVLMGMGTVLNDIPIILVEARNVESVTHTVRSYADFIGPLKIDYRRRRFVTSNIHDEDWLFVNRKETRPLREWLSGAPSGETAGGLDRVH